MSRLFFIVFIIFTVSCGEFNANTVGSESSISDGSPGDGGSSVDSGVTESVMKVNTLGVISQRQYLPKVKGCLGLDATSITAAELIEINALTANLSEEGDVKSIAAPTMMVMATLASKICSSLIKQEEKLDSPRFFKGYSFDKSKGQYDVVQTITLLSNSCSDRIVQPDEVELISNKVKEAFKEDSLKSAEEALFVCIAILSSGQFLLN